MLVDAGDGRRQGFVTALVPRQETTIMLSEQRKMSILAEWMRVQDTRQGVANHSVSLTRQNIVNAQPPKRLKPQI